MSAVLRRIDEREVHAIQSHQHEQLVEVMIGTERLVELIVFVGVPLVKVAHRTGSLTSHGCRGYLACVQPFLLLLSLLSKVLLHVGEEAVVGKVILVEAFSCIVGLPPATPRHVLTDEPEAIVVVFIREGNEVEVVDGTEDIREIRHHVSHIDDGCRFHLAEVSPAATLGLLHLRQHIGLAATVVVSEGHNRSLVYSHVALAENVMVDGFVQSACLIVVVVASHRRIGVHRDDMLAQQIARPPVLIDREVMAGHACLIHADDLGTLLVQRECHARRSEEGIQVEHKESQRIGFDFCRHNAIVGGTQLVVHPHGFL